ncbi:molybdopterin dinucleotide binding domain-containing protein [Shewanella goraebulensis]|uniref:molybdopterin dinucleotide binding domain-containing protein n=1 Tax=Shewanella goraebulensis TaxID=3050637 RepID=UPI00254EDF5C|nr:molybdopterin dinucleotide binding domain-containing protein [Shewanella goraebulensis]
MIDKSKRNFLKAGAIASASASLVACHPKQPKPKPNKINVSGETLPPEYQVIDGKLKLHNDVRTGFARCFGCFDGCSVRVRIDKNTNEVQRVSGNPFCPNNRLKPEPLESSVESALINLTNQNSSNNRATTCARGTAAGQAVDSKQRITSVLKRVGQRGERRWVKIPYEQAIQEILNGGNLFGEGHVDGLRAIHQPDKLACPSDPLFGPASKQLMLSYSSVLKVRTSLLRRFSEQYRTTIGQKAAYCGLSQAIGISRIFKSGIFTGAAQNQPDLDFSSGPDGCKFALYVGNAPSNSGNSLNLISAQLAEARTQYNFEYVQVDPILRNATIHGTGGSWQPILPGQDTPFLFGLMRHIFENDLYNVTHLQNVSDAAAKKSGELHHTNASYLVVQEPTHPQFNKFLRNKLGDIQVLVNGKLTSVNKTDTADLMVEQAVTLDGESINVMSSLALLRQQAYAHSMKEYASVTGIAESRIRQIATKLTQHGRRATVKLATGANSSDASTSGWCAAMLNVLIGCHHAKGGATTPNGGVSSLSGPYELAKVEGGYGKKDQGVSINREGKYELSAEYQNKLTSGQNPYPSQDPWSEVFPMQNAAEMLTSHVNKRPYQLKAFISWRANVLYGAAGLPTQVFDAFKHPHGEYGIPLVIGIVDQISTTTEYADYLIPDFVHLEEVALESHWGSERQGVSASGHMLESKIDKNAAGHTICMEQFLIDISKELKLKGFGDKAIKKQDGNYVDLHTEAQWSAYSLANAATSLKNKLPQATARDVELSGIPFATRLINSHLTPDEQQLVARLLSRGGYYDDSPRYDGDFQANKPRLCLNLYNEGLTEGIHCYTGEHRSGVPIYRPNQFWNGDKWREHWPESEYPLVISSYKPTARSNWSVSYHRTTEFSPTNYVYMHQNTGSKLGLTDGQQVKVASAINRPALGTLKLVEDMVEGAVSVAMGFGHTAYGANDIWIDDQKLKGDPRRSAGTEVNTILPNDPTREGFAPLVDVDTYCTCRHGVPVKVVAA